MTMYRASIVFVDILFYFLLHFTLIKGENEPIGSYITDDKLTHKEAKQRCDMVGLENVVNVTSLVPPSEPVWIDASVKYTEWAEYTRTYLFKNEFESDLNISNTNSSDVLRWCLQNCNRIYFGLQNGKCACTVLSAEDFQDINKKIIRIGNDDSCSGTTAICGTYEDLSFAIYKRVKIPEPGIGNCMTFTKRDSNKVFQIRPCSSTYKQLCRKQNRSLLIGSINNTWKASYKACWPPLRMTVYSYLNEIKNEVFDSFRISEEVWLGSIRTYEQKSPSEGDATFCLAAQIRSDGTVTRVVRTCSEDLSALCKGTKQMSVNTKDSPNNALQLEMIIVIALASILVVVVVIVIVLCYRCIRRKGKNSERSSSVQSAEHSQQNQNVVYAEVSKPKKNSDLERFTVATDKTRTQPMSHSQNAVYTMVNKSKNVRKQEQPSNNATDQSASSSDIYDHAHQTPKKQIADDNNYDTMKNLLGEEENVYNTSNEKEESRMIIVDNDNEYSHAHFNDENNT